MLPLLAVHPTLRLTRVAGYQPLFVLVYQRSDGNRSYKSCVVACLTSRIFSYSISSTSTSSSYPSIHSIILGFSLLYLISTTVLQPSTCTLSLFSFWLPVDFCPVLSRLSQSKPVRCKAPHSSLAPETLTDPSQQRKPHVFPPCWHVTGRIEDNYSCPHQHQHRNPGQHQRHV